MDPFEHEPRPSSDLRDTTYPAFLSAGDGLDQLKASVASRIAKLSEQPEPVKPPQQDARSVELARSLCKLQGFDPDQHVVDVRKGMQAQKGPFGSTVANITQASWTLYWDMAREIIDGLDRS